jgi:hypothetical protein
MGATQSTSQGPTKVRTGLAAEFLAQAKEANSNETKLGEDLKSYVESRVADATSSIIELCKHYTKLGITEVVIPRSDLDRDARHCCGSIAARLREQGFDVEVDYYDVRVKWSE